MSAKAKRFRARFGGVADNFADQNRKAAELVLSHGHGKCGCLACVWARAFLAEHGGGQEHGNEPSSVQDVPGQASTRG